MELTQVIDKKTLIQCALCKMYRVINHTEPKFLQGIDELHNKPPIITCFSCQEKETLLTQIDDLNKTVFKLNERITSLQEIHYMEESLDKTINDISTQLSAFHVSDNTYEVPPAEHEEIVNNSNWINSKALILQADETYQSTDTSVWTESESSKTSMESRSNFSSSCSAFLFCDASTQTDSVPTSLVCPAGKKSCETQTEGKSFITNGTQTVKNKHVPIAPKPIYGKLLRNTLPTDIIEIKETICQSAVDSCTAPNHTDPQSSMPCVNNIAWIGEVETLVIGNGSLTNFKHSLDKDELERTFKIARKNSSISDLVETTEYFLTVFPNTKRVFFHGGTCDMKHGKTEMVKAEYLRLITTSASLGVKLILSGPLPNLMMSTETFSRAIAINEWLLNSLCSQINI